MRFFLWVVVTSAAWLPAGSKAQQAGGNIGERIDALIMPALQSAVTRFPCKLKSRGKIKMLRWEEIDECLNDAANQVDYETLAAQLKALRRGPKAPSGMEFAGLVETSLATHSVPFDQMFVVKDPKALLPLTNSVLKFLPQDSLQDAPVFDRAGIRMGSFAGTYSYERSGGLSVGTPYRLTLFQYKDRNDNIQAAPDKLLLDSFGVPWSYARSQPGFRLTSDKLAAAFK
jgi:hypothetical protein